MELIEAGIEKRLGGISVGTTADAFFDDVLARSMDAQFDEFFHLETSHGIIRPKLKVLDSPDRFDLVSAIGVLRCSIENVLNLGEERSVVSDGDEFASRRWW